MSMTPPRPSPWRGGGCSAKSDMLNSDNRDSKYYKWFETKTLKINVLRLPPLQGEGRGGVILDQIELINIYWYDSDQSFIRKTKLFKRKCKLHDI